MNAHSRPTVETDLIASWKYRIAPHYGDGRAHAMTVDVEDYFQVEAFFRFVDRADWDARERRVEANTDKILQMFDDAHAQATFFVLAWVAERHPALVRRIVAAGHELASHGREHRRADSQDRKEFLEDAQGARKTLEDIGGIAVRGYRAASFSISKRNLWTVETLEEAGYTYSSSIYPVRHDLYGIPEAPTVAFHPIVGSGFMEIPPSSFRAFGANYPCGGGGFFRLLPYAVSRATLRLSARQRQRPNVFYFHPWEIDPDQPRIEGVPLRGRVRHYTNLHKMQGKVERLLRAFDWTSIDRIFPVQSLPAP
ncbi:MAG TPA: XrtA system polysaccharide deacetylase [Rhizomicrobium sp.]|nr:XrtA system polysaccharide deacetylase [Rhizomicrobium sp.]